MADDELEDMMNRYNLTEDEKQYYRDWYNEERKHYPFGEIKEGMSPPPFQPKKKGWTINRKKGEERRTV